MVTDLSDIICSVIPGRPHNLKANRKEYQMRAKSEMAKDDVNERFSINIAIAGGGRNCRFFLDLIHGTPSPVFDIKILGVCDKNPDAEGILLAEQMGIYTTDNLHNLLNIDQLDSVLELTGKRHVLLEIIRLKPKGVGVLEFKDNRIVRNFVSMISRRLEATEQKLSAEKTLTNLLIRQSTTSIVFINTDFTIDYANDAYLKTVKMPKAEVIGAHCYKISHGLNTPCSSAFPGVKCPMLETLRTGKDVHVIHDHPGLDGRRIYCDLTTYPIKDDAGDVTQVIEFWRDVTTEFSDRWTKKAKEFESNIQQMIQEDRMISLGKLAASVAHEINNPIQGLLTFCGCMQDILSTGPPAEESLEEFKGHLQLMSTELERVGGIVSGLLSFAREKGVEHTQVDVNRALDAALSLTRHKMKLGNIRLTTELYPTPIMAVGDINQLQQCFLNLIFNAVDSMPEGGELSVTSRMDGAAKKAWFSIRDTGHGIPEDIKNNLFDPFFTTKEVGKSTGLGLSIVYGVVKNHRGTIKVDSRENEGTTFTLTFPVIPYDDPNL
jgi:two-component system, NtrC family, sensor kinase